MKRGMCNNWSLDSAITSMTDSQTRSFAERKLIQLQLTPALSRDKHAFTTWMNSITNDILRGETGENLANDAPNFPSSLVGESRRISADMHHASFQGAAISSSNSSQLSANQRVRFASAPESTECLVGTVEPLEDAVSDTVDSKISIADEEDEVGNSNLELSTSSWQTTTSISSSCSVLGENSLTTVDHDADRVSCDDNKVILEVTSLSTTNEERSGGEIGSCDERHCLPVGYDLKHANDLSQLSNLKLTSDTNDLLHCQYDDLTEVPSISNVLKDDIELNLSGTWNPNSLVSAVHYHNGPATFPSSNRQPVGKDNSRHTNLSQLQIDFARTDYIASQQNSNNDLYHRIPKHMLPFAGKKEDFRNADANQTKTLQSIRERVDRLPQNHAGTVDLSHITFQVMNFSQIKALIKFT